MQGACTLTQAAFISRLDVHLVLLRKSWAVALNIAPNLVPKCYRMEEWFFGRLACCNRSPPWLKIY